MSDHLYWDEVAAQSDGLPDGWRRHGRRAHLALIEDWIGEPQGRWLKTDLYEERLATRSLIPFLTGPGWTGVDLSPDVAGQATELTGCTAVVSDVRALPFGDGVLDGVLSTSTLDHFDDEHQILLSMRELRRVLKPGGQLLLTLDNPRQPLIRLRNALPRSVAERTGLVPFEVGRTLDATAGQRALADAAFEVRAVTHVLHAPHVIGTRAARWHWWEEHALPGFDRLSATRLAPWTGHYVAFLAVAA